MCQVPSSFSGESQRRRDQDPESDTGPLRAVSNLRSKCDVEGLGAAIKKDDGDRLGGEPSVQRERSDNQDGADD